MLNKKYNILYLLFVSLFLFFGTADAATQKNIVFSAYNSSYWIDGTAYSMDTTTTPHLEQGRVFIPLRYLGYALGLQDQDISWDETNRTVLFNFTDAQIKLVLNEPVMEVNGEQKPMDVAPLLINERIYLPASFIAAALGYVSLWDENSASICINPSADWLTKVPKTKTPAPQAPETTTNAASDTQTGTSNKPLAVSQLFFPATKDNNVYNAGIAAKYVNGKVLKPGEEFSFNQVVGIRSKERGFIKGQNVDGKPENGGGVCRTSTVLYQVAQKAGFKITERHPHIPPVWYTPVGTDATVVWGVKDLKFTNTLKHPVTIGCGLEEKKEGGFRLYAEIHPYEQKTPINQ